jgi:hypothetical protein
MINIVMCVVNLFAHGAVKYLPANSSSTPTASSGNRLRMLDDDAYAYMHSKFLSSHP